MADIRLKNILFLTLAGIINAFGVTFFLYPVNLYDSGISGTSMLLAQITPDYLALSLFLLLLNFPLFLYGYKKMGLTFTIYSIYAVIVYSLAAWLITDVLPVDVSIASPLAEQDLLLCAIFGGLISGIGSGLTIRFGGAIDGVEILAVLFAKKLNLSVGMFVMGYNVVLYIVAGFVKSSWILPLYSIITYAAASKTVDFIAEGLDKAKSAMIITNKSKQVCDALSKEFGNGITLLPAKGYYSGEEKTMIYFVVNRFQISRVRSIVQKQDRNAYVTITEVSDVLGNER
ncbi:MAG: YitT family protein [Lachnospiraceae bacterium]|nr:YitT family protein [Lachnospiraceae bacterium]